MGSGANLPGPFSVWTMPVEHVCRPVLDTKPRIVRTLNKLRGTLVISRISRWPLALGFIFLSAAAAPDDAPAPVLMTAQEDHQRLMDLLHIKELRPGADGRNTQAPNYAN